LPDQAHLKFKLNGGAAAWVDSTTPDGTVYRGMVNSQSLPPAPLRRPLCMETCAPVWGRFLLAFICLALLLGPLAGLAATAPPPDEPAGPFLRSFKISGARLVPQKLLKAEITMSLPSLLPWKKLPVFKEEELEGDLARLKALYQRQGFYHTEIIPTVETEDDQVKVEIRITEGPYVQVVHEEVTIAPTAPPLDLSALQRQWPLKQGDRFTVDSYEALKRLYLDYLSDHGHPRAQAEGKVYLDDEKNTARIEVTIQPGPLYYFGDIKITGKQETPGYLVRRQLTFKPGEVFSVKELYDSQRKLYALDLFQSVTMTPEEAKEQDNRIPVEVVLQEKKKRSVKLGLGYGDEDRFRAKLGLRFRNLGGGGRTLDVDGKHSAIEDRVVSTFTNPQLWGSHNDFIFQSGYIRRYLPAFTDKSYFTQERLERELFWKFRGYLGHGLEFARPFNIPEETLAILTTTTPGKLYRASMLIGGLRRETMDNQSDPHRGSLLAWTADLAPDFLGSNLQFLRNVVEGRRYQAIGETNVILAGRLRFGAIQPIQSTHQIPIFRNFFAGGYNSVRGYRFDYLGPRNAAGQPLGGEALLEGSLEARIPIYKEFRAAVFMDFGNVFPKIPNLDLGQLKYAPGVELRYMTPIGPIGVGIGIPTNPINSHKDNYRVYFSIGQAF
jgi:outer membrane protein insertion porin family